MNTYKKMHVILFFCLLNFFNLIDGMAFAVDLPEIFSKDMESVHKYYNEFGLYCFRKNEYQTALEYFDKAIAVKPDFMEAYNNRGLVFAKQQKFKSALADYSRAIELNPSNECVFYNRAFSYLNQKLFDSAIKDYSKAIELNPGYTSAYVNRGVAFHRAGNHKLAFQDYNKALLLDPEHISAIINRGNLFREQKKFKEALLDYHNGIQLQPDHFMANLNQAYCNFFSGEFENASLGFNRCIGIKSIDFYLYIWKFLSDKRLGFSNQRIFPEDLEALLDDDIPRLVAEILLERKDPSSILKTLADDKEKQCEVFFYVGEYYLLKNNTSKASKFFNDCISTGINYCIEYQAAKVELGRL